MLCAQAASLAICMAPKTARRLALTVLSVGTGLGGGQITSPYVLTVILADTARKVGQVSARDVLKASLQGTTEAPCACRVLRGGIRRWRECPPASSVQTAPLAKPLAASALMCAKHAPKGSTPRNRGKSVVRSVPRDILIRTSGVILSFPVYRAPQAPAASRAVTRAVIAWAEPTAVWREICV